LAMDVPNEIIGHEEEVLEEQLIADDAAFYNEEYVEVEEGNEHYFVEEGGIVNVDDSDQAQYIQHSPQGHYVDVPYGRPYGQNIPQVPRHQRINLSALPSQPRSVHQYGHQQPGSSQRSYGGGAQYGHRTYYPGPGARTSTFSRFDRYASSPVANISVNSQSETRLREVNYQDQMEQKPLVRGGTVVNASSLSPRKNVSREVLSGSALQTSPLFTYLNFARMTKPRKSSKKRPCNCTKSMCLKLYCECFANGEFCLDCNCKDCHNNLENEAERSRAIKASLERNPNAFKPKIGVSAKTGRNTDLERLHQKGCHCKKSNCLKNYCECYEAKVPCTDRCKCTSCRNTEADRSQKFKDKFSTTGLAQLAAAAAADARAATPFSDDEEDIVHIETNPKSQPWYYLSDDVIEVVTNCLVGEAHECLKANESEEELEKRILHEFGRCLEQVIENASSASTHATVQTFT
jgi:hypothetical protein